MKFFVLLVLLILFSVLVNKQPQCFKSLQKITSEESIASTKDFTQLSRKISLLMKSSIRPQSPCDLNDFGKTFGLLLETLSEKMAYDLVYSTYLAFRDIHFLQNQEASKKLALTFSKAIKEKRPEIWNKWGARFYPRILVYNLFDYQGAIEFLEEESFTDEFSQKHSILLKCYAYLKLGLFDKASPFCLYKNNNFEKDSAYFYLNLNQARFLRLQGNHSLALKTLSILTKKNIKAYEVWKNLYLIEETIIMEQMGQIKKTTLLNQDPLKIKSAVDLDDRIRWLKAIYAKLLFKNNFFKQAEAVFKSIKNDSKDRPKTVAAIVKDDLFSLALEIKIFGSIKSHNRIKYLTSLNLSNTFDKIILDIILAANENDDKKKKSRLNDLKKWGTSRNLDYQYLLKL